MRCAGTSSTAIRAKIRKLIRDEEGGSPLSDTLLSMGLLLALSTQPWADTGCGGVLGYWHEYLTFVISIQGVATGLATLMWLLVASSPDRRVNPGGTHG